MLLATPTTPENQELHLPIQFLSHVQEILISDFNIYLADYEFYLCFKFQYDRTINTAVKQVSFTLCCLLLRVCFSLCRRSCMEQKTLSLVIVSVYVNCAKGIWLSSALERKVSLVIFFVVVRGHLMRNYLSVLRCLCVCVCVCNRMLSNI